MIGVNSCYFWHTEREAYEMNECDLWIHNLFKEVIQKNRLHIRYLLYEFGDK